MSVERTVTFNLSQNVDDFLTAYANLLKYKSMEDFLKEEIQEYFDAENMECLLPNYFDNNEFMNKIQKRYGLKPH